MAAECTCTEREFGRCSRPTVRPGRNVHDNRDHGDGSDTRSHGRGRILAVNDRAQSLLRQGEWLSDKEGVLQARAPDDQYLLARLVAEALPPSGAVPVSGSMRLGRVSGLPPLVVHVKPVGVPQPDYGARHVAALVLLVEPGRHPRLDPDVVTRTLGLTPAESQVAVWLADGQNVRDIARATGLTDGAIYWHLKQIYRKLPNLTAGGPGAVGAVDRRVRVTATRPVSSLGGPVARPRAGSSPTHDYFPGTANPGSDWKVFERASVKRQVDLDLKALGRLGVGRSSAAATHRFGHRQTAIHWEV